MDKNEKEAQRKRKKNSKVLISMCHWRLHMFVALFHCLLLVAMLTYSCCDSRDQNLGHQYWCIPP